MNRSEMWRNRQKVGAGRRTQCARKRDYWDRWTGRREQARVSGERLLPHRPPPTSPRQYLSKESSVLAQELKPLSPRAVALCPGVPASAGAGGCGARPASTKPGVSARDKRQITVLQDVHRYRWSDLSSIPPSLPSSIPLFFLFFSCHPSLQDS